MDANLVNASAVKIAAPVSGAAVGLMLQDFNGHPAWLVLVALTVSLAFGIASSIGRSDDRAAAFSVSKWNAGALWVMAFVAVLWGKLDIPSSMITALVLGLMGSPAIEAFLKKIGPWFT